jgi:tropomyosin
MDKIKEKMNSLRIEADTNLSRAEQAEQQIAEIKKELDKKEQLVNQLNNKVVLLQGDLERAENRAQEHKLKKQEVEKDENVVASLRRKTEMLEGQVDQKEKERKDAVEKYLSNPECARSSLTLRSLTANLSNWMPRSRIWSAKWTT